MRIHPRQAASRLVLPTLLVPVGLVRASGVHAERTKSSRVAPAPRSDTIGRHDRAVGELRWAGAEPSVVFIAAVSGESPAKDVSTLIQGARQALARLLFQEARDKAQSAASREPRNAKAHAVLGISYVGLGDLSTGEKELEQAIRLDGNLALAHAGVGILYYNRALSLAGSAAGSAPPGEVQRQLGRAEAEFKEALRLDSQDASAYDGLGSIHYYRKEYPDAIKQFQRAVKLDPEFVASYFNLGNAYLASHKWSEAEAYYRKAISLYSQRAEFHALLAAALLGQGRAIEAQKEAREARRLGLESHWIYDELKSRGWAIGGLALQPPDARAG